MTLRLGLAAVALLAATGFAAANEEIINLRKEVMQTNGQAAKVAVMMIRGEIAFDPVVATGAAEAIAGDVIAFPDLFPEGTETGDTKATPAIWSDMEGFRAAAERMVTAANAAATAAGEGQEAFAEAFNAVGQACGACHETYRAK